MPDSRLLFLLAMQRFNRVQLEEPGGQTAADDAACDADESHKLAYFPLRQSSAFR